MAAPLVDFLREVDLAADSVVAAAEASAAAVQEAAGSYLSSSLSAA